MAKQYVKKQKPTIVEAIQWTGDNLEDFEEFFDKIALVDYTDGIGLRCIKDSIRVDVPLLGDYVVRHDNNLFSVFSQDVFAKLYEPLTTDTVSLEEQLLRLMITSQNLTATVIHYEKASSDASYACVKEIYDTLLKEIGDLVNFTKLDAKTARTLGLRKWDNTNPALFLIPIYLVPLIPIGIELTSIRGNKIIYDGSNIELDTRYGMLAYGFMIEDDKEAN